MFGYICKQSEEIIVERFGRYHKTVSQPGLYLKTPFDRVAMRLTKDDFRHPIGVQLKTADDLFISLDVTCTMRIVDPKQFFYSSVTPASDACLYLLSNIKQEMGALTLKEISDTATANAAIGRAMTPLQQKIRDDYGIELVSATQQSLHIAEQVKEAMAKIDAYAQEARAKALDAKVSAATMQRGLDNDVTVGKPLTLKRRKPPSLES